MVHSEAAAPGFLRRAMADVCLHDWLCSRQRAGVVPYFFLGQLPYGAGEPRALGPNRLEGS